MKILVVCTGNICRSPVAERMLQQRSSELGLDLVVSSAGTRALNGKPMHPESVRLLRDRCIDSAGFVSRLLTPALASDADLVIGLTRDHRAVARQLAPMRWRRMHTLREIANAGTYSVPAARQDQCSTGLLNPNDPGLDIEDPMGRPAEVFDTVADDIEATMDGLVAWIERQLAQHDTVQQVAK